MHQYELISPSIKFDRVFETILRKIMNELARISVLAIVLGIIATALLINLTNPRSEQIQKIMLNITSIFKNDPEIQESYLSILKSPMSIEGQDRRLNLVS